MFVVIAVEHTDDFGNPPMVLGKFNTKDEAEKYVEEHLKECLLENPDQKRYDDIYGLYSENCSGWVNYSYIIEIVDLENI